ncbi:MAG: hypothetical protein PHV00_06050 [Syntrophales bacterium]|jgi:hypothetical protein|nr:hypothetical protein [Syntrophales bacterium]
MGSLPRLKIKDEIRYRKGSTCESENCKACKHFYPAFIIGVAVSATDASRRPYGDLKPDRCEIIGLRGGARYRVRPDYTCDRQEMGQRYQAYLDHLRGGTMTSMAAQVSGIEEAAHD